MVRMHVPLSQRERRELTYSPDAVGLALHSRRASEGLTQDALGDRLRISGGTIRNWEVGGMPAVAARLLSYAYEKPGAEELWRARALRAEAALQHVTEIMATYRGSVRQEFAEQLNGHRS